jgi:monoamine oxidase
MQTARIAIIGAGLSGLYAAWLLERQGIRDYVLLEARDTLGGRIVSVAGPGQASPDAGFTADAIDRFDLGPTWFWPEYQHELRRLVDALGLEQFEQFETGDMMVERSPDEPPVRMRGYVNSPASIRVIGGMSSLVDRLRRALDPQRVITGQSVNRMRIVDGDVELDSEDASGGFTTWRVTQVLLALPPRLAENTIAFEPELPPMLARQWRATATWMAPHAKYIAIYDTPFWRDQGLSGEARSARGPLGEIHDASMPGGSAALFGFFGVPAQVRQNVSDDVLCMHSRAQFVRLFGHASRGIHQGLGTGTLYGHVRGPRRCERACHRPCRDGFFRSMERAPDRYRQRMVTPLSRLSGRCCGGRWVRCAGARFAQCDSKHFFDDRASLRR